MLFHLLMFIISTPIYCSWHIADRQLPQPSGAAQMAFNNLTSTVYLFGGYSLNGAEIIYSTKIYKRNINNKSNEWIYFADVPGDCFLSQIQNTVTIDDLVYFIGVNNNSYTSDVILLFNITTEQFVNHNIPKYKYPSALGCLVTNNTHIFMVGGLNGVNGVQYVQILNIKANNWTYQTIDLSLISDQWSLQICSMINNTLYTFGGVTNVTNWTPTNVIYKYDTLSSDWHFIGNLSHRTSQGWAVYSDKYEQIYIVTAEKNVGNVTLSIFDIKEEKIIFKSQLLLATGQTPMLLYDDIIMIFGGYGYYSTSLVFTQFIQMAELPLIEHKSSTSKKSVSIGLFIGIISINSIICILLGCVFGCVSYRYIINKQNIGNANAPLNNNEQVNQYDGLRNENSPSPHIM